MHTDLTCFHKNNQVCDRKECCSQLHPYRPISNVSIGCSLRWDKTCSHLSHLGVDEERQHQHGQHQVSHRQADDEVVGGGLQRLLGQHAQTHQQVAADDDHDQQHPEHQRRQVAILRGAHLHLNLHRRAQVGCHVRRCRRRRGSCAPSASALSWMPWRSVNSAAPRWHDAVTERNSHDDDPRPAAPGAFFRRREL